MASFSIFRRLDWTMIAIIVALMAAGLLVISSYSSLSSAEETPLLTPIVRVQLRWYCLGFALFFIIACCDYNKLREWTWPFYLFSLLSLLGLFFTPAVQGVHRWYKLPLIGISLQPSEYAKLVVIFALAWFLEREKQNVYHPFTALKALAIVAPPFLLILKQPDLGTSLVLFPITLVIFYVSDLHPPTIRLMTFISCVGLCFIALLFLGIIKSETIRPYATLVLKEYQFDRLDPNSHQQQAAATAIAVGGISGVGWRQSTFTSRGWLPTPYTDSVFPAFGEEFGLIGLLVLLALFYALIYRAYRVSLLAKDSFGRLLAAGVSTYLAVHILINVGMMCGFLPITGVPLILITYGGSSVLATMMALGLLQSIYIRRFMFAPRSF